MKKLMLSAILVLLILSLTACGSSNTVSSANSTGGSSAAIGNPDSSTDAYGGDIGYSNLIDALQEQGEIKVKARYSTIYADGSTGSESMEIIGKFYEVALGDVQREGTTVTADFTAIVKNDSRYIEEPLHIIATLQSDGAGNYTFASARTEGDLPIVVKPVVPFSVDLLYNDDFVLVYACSDAALEAQRDRILFNDSITVESRTLSTVIENQIFVPMTHQNVKDIELLPYSKNDIAVKGSDFEFSARFKITLQNDVIVYCCGDTNVTSENKWISDAFMIYGFSGRTYSTATETENL